MKAGREFLAFAIVGAAGFVVDVAVLYLAAPLLGWYGARVLSFLAAATATWALNRRYTFAARRSSGAATPIVREYLGYLATMLGGAVVNYGAYVLVLHWASGPWAPAAGVALGSCAGLAVNFLSARYLVFRTPRR
ncbi:putative flippase GtrA [Variovorax beijingensis]|jgi:putative flippase GtrA|uniref:Flippase GtrA n=2 Tax=Variovorax TaxID=34072 RepID=A0AAE4BUV5_VARPD|nr:MULTISPECIES: GtrA family protein [Variovorax]MBD9667617.1 GtrA family protein [Variovorax sp. VRV01]MDR6425356.1 putative flippase GtrA [Variovorax paradoxus]TWD90379.1 putative flippase GtrA [Variovorax beijingensis]